MLPRSRLRERLYQQLRKRDPCDASGRDRRFNCVREMESSSAGDAQLAEKAISFLRRNPNQIHSLTPDFTPEAASYLIIKTQSHQTLTLNFLNWARSSRNAFFTARCKCLALHVLTKFKLYKTAQSLAEGLAAETDDATGALVFNLVKDSYQEFGSSSAVFDLLVKSYCSVNQIDKARNFIRLAKLNGFMPGVLAYNSVIEAVVRTKGPVEFAAEICKEMVENGISPNVFTYNIMIRGFCGVGNMEKGLGIFDEMEKKGCLPNVVTFNTLLDAYCKMGKMDKAMELFKLMCGKGLRPNLISYNVVVNGLCLAGRMSDTSEVLREMSLKGMVPDEVTYNTLVNGYCREGNFHQALVLHEEMLKNGLSPNVVTYTALINSMCKGKNLNRALELVSQMRIRGISLNARTYTTLVDGFAQQGFLNDAYKFLAEMIKSGFSPSRITYNALIHGHCVLEKMEHAIGMIKKMNEDGFTPDVVSYSTVISGFCGIGNMERAFRVKQEMYDKGISSDVVTYSSLINGLCEQRRLDEACDLCREMFFVGLHPDEVTYTTMINAYCREGDIYKALSLHNEMIQKGFLPDTVTYSVLINGLNKQARTREAKQLLFKLFYDDSVPNDVTYNTLIENCSTIEFKSVVPLLKGFCMKGLMGEADKVLASMIKKNYKPDEAVYNVMIHGHCKSGSVQKAYSLYNEILRAGFVPHHVSIIALTKALIKEGMNHEVKQVVEKFLRSSNLTDSELAKVLVNINHKEGNMVAMLNVLSEMAKDGLLPVKTVKILKCLILKIHRLLGLPFCNAVKSPEGQAGGCIHQLAEDMSDSVEWIKPSCSAAAREDKKQLTARQKAVGLGGWHWLVLKNGIEVKLQRNALSVLEPPTGNDEDNDEDIDNSSSGSDIGRETITVSLQQVFAQDLGIWITSFIMHFLSKWQPLDLGSRNKANPELGVHSHGTILAQPKSQTEAITRCNIHAPQLVNFRKLGMNSLWRYYKHFNLGIIHYPTEGTTKFCPLPCLFHWSGT
ncbi:unnamed protein product [Rhodiola kirilowii]